MLPYTHSYDHTSHALGALYLMMLLAPKIMDTFQQMELAPEGPQLHEVSKPIARRGRRAAAPRMQASDSYDGYVNSRSNSSSSGRSKSVDK